MILIVAFAVILVAGVERLLARLNIRPEEPAAGGGFADVVNAVRGWLTKRRG